ncbi:hypothetical protein HMPREF3183_00259 [Peptostreptococcus anaerobius]|uniref:Uncharacterized protein n=1 Tax=Peptostreptococcus anaerobius TaxID=1261 RepID=A0A135YU68_9FIRM|nr:hypothetical protein HMPREF9998_00442 [Peptostreptococcus anaerobius VPI 4330 = DSM 2949]KXB73255.1 hypothetical protein HMPREF3183_00259 [Peptostreptococcus anaerobius]KXI12891.1 hypothetical protein HMPREF3195_00977 [Peptostreptococcus anaerobius]
MHNDINTRKNILKKYSKIAISICTLSCIFYKNFCAIISISQYMETTIFKK